MQMFTCLLMSIVIVFFNQWISQWSFYKWMVTLFCFCFVSFFCFFSDEYFSGPHCNIRSLTAHFDIFLCIFLSRLWDSLKSSLKLNNNFNQYWLTRNFSYFTAILFKCWWCCFYVDTELNYTNRSDLSSTMSLRLHRPVARKRAKLNEI